MLVLNNLKSSEDWASHIVTGEQKLFLGVAPSHWADSHTRLGKVSMYSMWTGMEFGSNFLSHPSCSVLSLWKKSNNWQNAKAKLDCWLSATLNPFPPQCCFDWGMFVWHCPSAMTLIQINFHTGSCGGSFFFFFFWLLSRLYKTKVTLWYASMENDIFCDWLNCLRLIPPDRQHSFFLAMDTTELNKCLKETSKAFKSSFPRHYTSWLSIPW